MLDTQNYIDNITRLKAPIDIELRSKRKWHVLSTIALFISGLSMLFFFIFYGIKSNFNSMPNWVFLLTGCAWISAVVKHKYDDAVDILKSKITRLHRALTDIGEINLLLENQKGYVFYLRDFNSGREEKQRPVYGASLSGIANPVNWPTEYGKKTTTMCLHYFNSKYPVVLLNNDLEKTLLKGGLYIYPQDNHWFDDFKKIGTSSMFTIIDYDFDRITKNIMTEIEALILIGKRNLIFIGTKAHRAEVDERFPKLNPLIVCNCYVENNKEGLQTYTHIDYKEFEDMCTCLGSWLHKLKSATKNGS